MESILIDEKADAMVIGHEELRSAIRELEGKGYVWSGIVVEQAGTGRTTTTKVLCRDD